MDQAFSANHYTILMADCRLFYGTAPTCLLCFFHRAYLHDTGATFIPVRVHSSSLLWLCIRLHDTSTKSCTGASSIEWREAIVMRRAWLHFLAPLILLEICLWSFTGFETFARMLGACGPVLEGQEPAAE